MSQQKQNYHKLCKIGSGAYGEVWKARDSLNPDMMVALKRIRSPTSDDGVSTSLLREVSLLIELNRHNNEHIVKLIDVCPGNHSLRGMELYLVFEHVDQDLFSYLEKAPPGTISLQQIKSIMYQLLDGISVIHENRIEHRDLKPQNVLITDSGLVKIADFGLARLYKPNSIQTSVVATLWYRSPEVLLTSLDGYASAVDIWGAGCIFGELVLRKPLFEGQSEHSQLVKIFETIGSPHEREWPRNETNLAQASFAGYPGMSFNELFPNFEPEGINLIKQMLAFNPQRRITAKGALVHCYFQNYQHVLIPIRAPECSNSNSNNKNPNVTTNATTHLQSTSDGTFKSNEQFNEVTIPTSSSSLSSPPAPFTMGTSNATSSNQNMENYSQNNHNNLNLQAHFLHEPSQENINININNNDGNNDYLYNNDFASNNDLNNSNIINNNNPINPNISHISNGNNNNTQQYHHHQNDIHQNHTNHIARQVHHLPHHHQHNHHNNNQ